MFCFTKQQLDYLAKQVSDIISTDNISNLRTNEDLSLVREDNISTLSFADRDTSKGLAYKILRTESTFAEQVTDEDTIYEIRYDFDLNEESVEIPAGCVLKFNGGKLSNGELIGNGAILDASPIQIFNNVLLNGFNLDKIDIRWFGAKEGEDIADVMDDVMKTYNQNIGVPIKMIGHYRLSRTIRCASGIVIWNDFMVPDLFDNRVHTGHALNPLGWLEVAAGITAFRCERLGLTPALTIPRGTTAFRGIKFTAEAQKDANDNPTVLLLQRIAGLPPRGFKIEDCLFENFDKAIMCDQAMADYGSIISQFLIDNCTFTSDNGYALWVENLDTSVGDLTINGLEMVRCTLVNTKLYLVGLYGVNKISEIVINGSSSAPLNNPAYFRIKYGTLELSQWYEEYLSGDFTIVGDRDFHGLNPIDYADFQATVCIKDWYTMFNSYDEESVKHPYLRLENISVTELPELFPKRNIILKCSSINRNALETRTYDSIRLDSIARTTDEASGISYGCIVVKTEDYDIVKINDTQLRMRSFSAAGPREGLFRGYFDCPGGTPFRKGIKDSFYVHNWDMSSSSSEKTKTFTLTPINGVASVFSNSRGSILTFVKERGSFSVKLLDSNDVVLANIITPMVPGICMIVLSGTLTSIAKLTMSRQKSLTTSLTSSAVGVRYSYEPFASGNDDRMMGSMTSILQNCLLLDVLAPPVRGATAERPTSYALIAGFEYFDTTLGKPIYYNGSGWVDATGASV